MCHCHCHCHCRVEEHQESTVARRLHQSSCGRAEGAKCSKRNMRRRPSNVLGQRPRTLRSSFRRSRCASATSGRLQTSKREHTASNKARSQNKNDSRSIQTRSNNDPTTSVNRFEHDASSFKKYMVFQFRSARKIVVLWRQAFSAVFEAHGSWQP